jgi:hypothetical protein
MQSIVQSGVVLMTKMARTRGIGDSLLILPAVIGIVTEAYSKVTPPMDILKTTRATLCQSGIAACDVIKIGDSTRHFGYCSRHGLLVTTAMPGVSMPRQYLIRREEPSLAPGSLTAQILRTIGCCQGLTEGSYM